MPRAFIVDSSKFREALLQEYCAQKGVDVVRPSHFECILDEIRQSQPEIIFLHTDLIRIQPQLLQQIRAQPPLNSAVVVMIASDPQALPQGADLILSSAGELAQLEPFLARMKKTVPRVLIASSFVRSNSALSQALTASGFEVTVAPTAGKALTEAESLRPATVLVDSKLVGMPCVEFIQRLREHVALKSAAIFVLSAKPDAALASALASQAQIVPPPFHGPEALRMFCSSAGMSFAEIQTSAQSA